MANTNWTQHLKETIHTSPRPQLIQALAFFETFPTQVLELGGGALNDAQYLLSHGANVTVVDMEPASKDIAEKIGSDKLTVTTARFDEYTFPTEIYDFVTAMYALSFNPPQTFREMIERSKGSLKKEGIFSGNIFGLNDEWSKREKMTFLEKEVVQELFADMEMLFFEELERDNILAGGQPKHWHEFRVIARKR